MNKNSNIVYEFLQLIEGGRFQIKIIQIKINKN